MKNKYYLQIILSFVFVLNVTAQEKGTFTDARDGKTYKTIKIGNQIWMAENLAFKASSGCWAYDNKSNNVTKYGYLYDWKTAKNVSPAGWHLPSDAEWWTLTAFLGGASVAGGKLKEAGTLHWKKPNTGATNASGFSALASGSCGGGQFFMGLGEEANFWTSNNQTEAKQYENYAWQRGLTNTTAECHRAASDGSMNAYAIRCIKN